MTQNMWNVFIMLGGIVAFALVVNIFDWLGRRRERQSRDRAA